MVYQFLRPADNPPEVLNNRYLYDVPYISSEVRIDIDPPDNPNDQVDIRGSSYKSCLLITKIIAPYIRNFEDTICIYTGVDSHKYFFEEFYYIEQGMWLMPTHIFVSTLQICVVSTPVPLHIYAIHSKNMK